MGKTIFGVSGGIVLSIALVFGLIIAGAGFTIWWNNGIGRDVAVSQANKNRAVTEHTVQYQVTQRTALESQIEDYVTATTDAQRIYAVNQAWHFADMLAPDEIPPSDSAWLSQHPRGSN